MLAAFTRNPLEKAMLYAVLFEDDESKSNMRPKYLPQHLEFLARHADQVTAAGPMLDPSDSSPAGGLWLVEADNPEAVEALVHEDPFWPTGLRKSVRVLHWRQVFADGRALL